MSLPRATTLLLLLALAAARPAAADEGWPATLDRVARGVVVLRVAAVRSFDTEPAVVSQATGFVVDARRGLILTNRHVVQPGPVTAQAVFLDREKVEVHAVYRDPVHDFGFFRYDPSQVHFMKPVELKLAPEAARVGLDVRLLGNDSGEKLSILAGTLARLDRQAPDYGQGHYGDFNTFYLQAASSTSGGSSGSPVVDVKGRVVALNAGGSRESAASFFLPLDRVARALRLLRRGQPVPRGTLQTVWVEESFDELRRLGLRRSSEAAVRRADPKALGLLVVDEIVPGGPADGRLEPGDVLLAADGHPVRGFVALEEIVDARVGGEVTLSVERGGVPRDVRVPVQDLHALTPDRYLEFGGGILNPFSYQLARSFAIPASGVYLASAGYAFGQSGIPGRVLVTEIGEHPIPDLDAAISHLASEPDGAKVRVRYVSPAHPRSPQVGVLRVDRRWYPMRSCRRDDSADHWACKAAPPPPPPPPAPPPASTRLGSGDSWAVRRLSHSMVMVSFNVPYVIDGVQGTSFSGAGLVVDAKRGLVLVDRDTVPVTLGDVEISFGGAVEVPGRVVALHPEHDLALVAYDPARIGDTPVEAATFDDDPLEPGDEVRQVVMTAREQLLARSSTVERVDAPSLPLPRTPRFRESNVDVVALTDSLSGIGGVLADRWGHVRALWLSFSSDASGSPGAFFGGVPVAAVRSWLPALEGSAPWHSLGAELAPVALSRARDQGLPDALARSLEERDPRRRVLAVRRLTAGTPAAEALQVGDLVVRADGALVTDFLTLERAAQDGEVALTVVRGGKPLELTVKTPAVRHADTRRVILWAGAILQPVPRLLARQRGLSTKGVYVAGRWRGSPSENDGLQPTRRILALNGHPTPDLDAFLGAIDGAEGRSVRLLVAELDGRRRVLTVEPDPFYWPTQELSRGEGGWTRRLWAPPATPARP